MFEDSLVESRVGQVSSSKRWTTLASIGLQGAIVGVVITLPLLHPEALPFRLEAPKVVMPLMPKPPVPVAQVQRESSASSASMAAQLASFGNRMGMPDGLPGGIGVGDGHGPAVSVAPTKAPVSSIHVSTGVFKGMLLAPILPVYPAIARAAHVEGAVVVEAVISRKGTIESLHVVSGPQMLQNAALDAIRAARYQPYRLNGEPTEVQTTITVNFRMNG
jgi:periplasmic protein TonB